MYQAEMFRQANLSNIYNCSHQVQRPSSSLSYSGQQVQTQQTEPEQIKTYCSEEHRALNSELQLNVKTQQVMTKYIFCDISEFIFCVMQMFF